MLLTFNGVDAETGCYLRPPVRLDQLAARRRRRPRLPIEGVDSRDLAAAGWGVIFAPGVPAAARDALRPLLEHRRGQASRLDERRYRELEAWPRETGNSFLARHGRRYGPVNPEKVPYYLLIVGGPEAADFDFQHEVDVQHAVGRLGFDTPEEYAAYAAAVVEEETRPAPPARQAVFFAPVHPDDGLTEQSAGQLVQPLAGALAAPARGWTVRAWTGETADKDRLGRLLGGGETPSLLFTAGHGIGLRHGDERQRELQGSLLCQGWPGPRAGRISAEHYFAARDVSTDARLQGLVSFHFACYSAGTPQWDSYAHLETGRRKPLAAQAFLARLPQALLGHPRGGALAVVGHVDQAFPCSFLWEDTGAQIEVFQSTLSSLMQGAPVGAAMEYFGQRYAEIAAAVAARLEPVRGAERAGDLELLKLWLANNDARGYAVLGDPAVRLQALP